MSKKIDKMQILKHFIEEPEREFHIRELAKITKTAPTTATVYLEDFKKENLLEKSKSRNVILFKANLENPLFKEIKKHYNIINILKSGLLEYLNEQLNYPEAIILFGSYAKGENTKNSDIDLFILTESKKEISLKQFEEKLIPEIQLFIYNKKELNNLKKINKDLLNNILNGIKLSGFIEVFE